VGRLTGRVAIVTGAASGIGRGVTRRYVDEGAAVVAADINSGSLHELADELAGSSGRVAAIRCDVGVEAEIDQVVRTALDRFGQVDILANIAQGNMDNPGLLRDTSPEQAMRSFVTGPLQSMLFMQKCLPTMMARHYGRVLNFASHSAVMGSPGFAAYELAKGAIQALTRNASQEWAAHGITTNCILPILRTPAYDLSPQGRAAADQLQESIPVGRFGTPYEDCGPLMVFLASEDAGYINGQMIGLDGGYRLIA